MRTLRSIAWVLVLLLVSCNKKESLQPVVKSKFLMGTIVQISVYGAVPNVDLTIEKAFGAIEEINKVASIYNDSSLISQVNRDAYEHAVLLDSNLYAIIKRAIEASTMSDGGFDITIGPLLKLWDYHNPDPQLPTEQQIAAAQKLVGYQNIELNNREIKFKQAGMRIDLGGIAKGYAVDKAADVLIKNGVKDALIDVGGNFRAICSELTAGKRKVWVKHPRNTDQFYGYFLMDNGSVATSGDYERFFIKESVRYHHIINPQTGFPANDCISVTIRAETAMEADALSTAVFVMGVQKGMNLINQLESVEGFIIFDKDGKLQHNISKGLSGKFFLTHQENE